MPLRQLAGMNGNDNEQTSLVVREDDIGLHHTNSRLQGFSVLHSCQTSNGGEPVLGGSVRQPRNYSSLLRPNWAKIEEEIHLDCKFH